MNAPILRREYFNTAREALNFIRKASWDNPQLDYRLERKNVGMDADLLVVSVTKKVV